MQILRGINWGIVNADLVMQVRAGAVARRANVSQDFTAANVLSGNDCESRKMSVQGFHAVAVIDHYFSSVPVAHSSLDDGAVRRRANRVALAGGNVDSGVECAFPIKRIQAGAERTGYDPLHWPDRWRISHIDRTAQGCWEPVGEIEPVHYLPGHSRGPES